MRTYPMRYPAKRTVTEWRKADNSMGRRVRSFLFRDLLPTLVIIIVLSVCTSFVAQKIEQAKASRGVVVVKSEKSEKSHP